MCPISVFILLLFYSMQISSALLDRSLFNIFSPKSEKPNIIFIIADDMGWNDVGFHGSPEIKTPNIDALAYNGAILQKHYVQPICTPSRAAFMTGKYPIRTGMQGYPIAPGEPRALPAGKLLPQYLKDLGYSTNLVGKWHLGNSRRNETPTYRGFDSHMGYYNGFVSYYDYVMEFPIGGVIRHGYDMRRGMDTAWDLSGKKYATDLFTDEAVRVISDHNKANPLFLMVSHLAPHSGNKQRLVEAPQKVINKYNYIANVHRRTYAAMVSKLDDSVGEIVQALKIKGILQNSIIVFLADNGAPTIGEYANWGSNYPLRGVKESLWEGGVRGAAAIWSPLLGQKGYVSNELMHITDWLPTLYAAAGGNMSKLPANLDGLNMWPTLQSSAPSPRTDILINIYEQIPYSAIRRNKWKLSVGFMNSGLYDVYVGDSGKSGVKCTLNVTYDADAVIKSTTATAIAGDWPRRTQLTRQRISKLQTQATITCDKRSSDCNPSNGTFVCLFDIESDPCETTNLAAAYPAVVSELQKALAQYNAQLVPQINKPVVLDAIPELYNYTWSNWLDNAPLTGCPAMG